MMPHTQPVRALGFQVLKMISHAAPVYTQCDTCHHDKSFQFTHLQFFPDTFPDLNLSSAEINADIFRTELSISTPEHYLTPHLLPDALIFRTKTETYNRYFQFILRPIVIDGQTKKIILFKPHTGGNWKPLKNPKDVFEFCAISCDDQFLIAIDTFTQNIYTLMYVDECFLKHPYRWIKAWGNPLWWGKNETLRPCIGFALSFMSPQTHLVTTNYERKDTEEKKPVDSFLVQQVLRKSSAFDVLGTSLKEYNLIGIGVTTIYALEPDGQHISIYDPWLNSGDIRKILTPQRGKIKCVSISASGSMLAVMGIDGRVYTRFWDFDSSGADDLIGIYSTVKSRPRQLPNINPETDDDVWDVQPDLPVGCFNQNLTLLSSGSHAKHYVLLVEGCYPVQNTQGHTTMHMGVFIKPIQHFIKYKSPWKFFCTQKPITQFNALSIQRDALGRCITSIVPNMFQGRIEDLSENEFFNNLQITDFNPYEGPCVITGVLKNGYALFLWLHNYDPTRFKHPHYSHGLEDKEWPQVGLIQCPKIHYDQLKILEATGDKCAQKFLELFEEHGPKGHFSKVKLKIDSRHVCLKIKSKSSFKNARSAWWVFRLRS